MQRVLSKNKPTPEQMDQAIERGKSLEELTKTKGWEHVEDFMAKARAGTHVMMEQEVQAVSTFTMAKLFGAYAKYLMMLFENRAYTKVKTYVRVSIQSGKKFSEEKRKRESAAEQK